MGAPRDEMKFEIPAPTLTLPRCAGEGTQTQSGQLLQFTREFSIALRTAPKG